MRQLVKKESAIIIGKFSKSLNAREMSKKYFMNYSKIDCNTQNSMILT